MNAKQWASTKVKDYTLSQAVPVTVLTNLLMLSKDPEDGGFYHVGEGYYGTVYRHDLTPGVVYKVAPNTYSHTVVNHGYKRVRCGTVPTNFNRSVADGFAVWATICMDYQAEFGNMPFLPKFYKVQHSRAQSVYAMEALTAFELDYEDDEDAGSTEARRAAVAFAEYLDVDPKFWDDAWIFDDDVIDDLNHFCLWLRRQLPDNFESWDLHSGNVMLRGDCPVLTDPWAGIPPTQPPVSLARRLSASLGVPA